MLDRSSFRKGVLLAALGASACTGAIGTAPADGDRPPGTAGPTPADEPSPPGALPDPAAPRPSGTAPPVAAAAAELAPPPRQLRRLTAAQTRRALRDLLGSVPSPLPLEEPPASAGLRAIGASVTALSPQGLELFEAAVEAALEPMFADPRRWQALVGCTSSGVWDAACARAFVEGFGRRAWRRPVAADERDRYLALGQRQATAAGSFAEGARAMASALLQSPHFAYRTELGGARVAGRASVRLTSFELASRLSFLLWGSTPDAALLAAAEAGALDSPEALRREAQRLLASPRAAEGLQDLVDDLLGLDGIALFERDPKKYPKLTPTVREAMRGEIVRLFQSVALDRGADLMELFDTDRTFVNEELGKLYGITVAGTSLVEARHPAAVPRAGLLTAAALLAMQDKQHETAPTRRGAFVREAFLCTHIPEPPDNVDVTLRPLPPGTVASRRRVLAQHAEDPSCAGCHALMDPVGLALENFDALGVYRTREDNGLVIDAAGVLDGKPFADPRALGRLLRQDARVRACLVKRVYQYAQGRLVSAYDDARLRTIDATFEADGRRLHALLLPLVQSDGFANVSATDR